MRDRHAVAFNVHLLTEEPLSNPLITTKLYILFFTCYSILQYFMVAVVAECHQTAPDLSQLKDISKIA